MARAQTTDCGACPTGRIGFGEAYCGTCGQPSTWASHDDRVAWEIAQWRRARSASSGGGVATIEAPVRDAKPSPQRNHALRSNVITLDPGKPHAADKPSFFSWFRRAAARLRELFVSSMKLDLDPIFEAPEVLEEPAVQAPLVLVEPVSVEEPLVVVEPVDQAPEASVSTTAKHVALTVEAAAAFIAAISSRRDGAAEPVAAVPNAAAVLNGESHAEIPAPPVATPKPAVVRKKPNRPTNKDLLKRALEMLTKVEKRLEHLEQELEVPARRDDEASL